MFYTLKLQDICQLHLNTAGMEYQGEWEWSLQKKLKNTGKNDIVEKYE